MKIFKRVYFCVLTVVLVLVIALGFAAPSSVGARIDSTTQNNASQFAERIQNVIAPATALNSSLDDSEAVRRELWTMLTSSAGANLNLGLAQSAPTTRHFGENTQERPQDPVLEADALFSYNEFTLFAPAGTNRGGNSNNNSWRHLTPIEAHNMGRAAPSVIAFGPHSGITQQLPHGNHAFRYVVGAETFARFDEEETMHVMVGREINNIAVVIPGNETRRGRSSDAILLVTSMDVARSGGGGAAAARIGAFVEEIRRLNAYQAANGRSAHDNDIIFLFADARHDSSLGAKVFMDQFVGFRSFERQYPSHLNFWETENSDWTFRRDNQGNLIPIPNIVERIVLAVNFDAIGHGSTPLLLNTSNDNGQLVRAFSNIAGSISSPLINDVYSDFRSDFDAFFNVANHNRSQDFDGFENLAAMNIVTYGNVYRHNTVLDVFDREDRTSIRMLSVVSNLVNGIVGEFGSDTSSLNDQNGNYYFSVLSWFTIRHTFVGPLILAILMILLIGATIFINIKNKVFSFNNLGKGVAVQLLTIILSIAIMFALYFLLGIILAGFSVFTLQHMIGMIYSNAGILIGFIFVALAIMSLMYIIIKKFFQIKATDVVRGGAIVFGLMAIILSFIVPSLGIIVGVPGLLVLANLFLSTLFKNKFKNKFGFDIERLFLYLVPMILFIMFILPSIVVVSSISLTILTPVLVVPFILVFMFIAPYATLLKAVLDKLLAKMPKRTIVVKKYSTEKIEDKAKPGKFIEVSGVRKSKEKVAWKYRHGAGIAIVSVLASIVILVSASFGSPFGGATGQGSIIANSNSFTHSIYSNSVLLIQDGQGETFNTSLRIHDTAMFRSARGWVDGFSWNTGLSAYTKDITIGSLGTAIMTSTDGGGAILTVGANPAGFGHGMSVLELSGTSIISAINVYASQAAMISGAEGIRFANTNNRDNMTIRLPMRYPMHAGVFIRFEFVNERAEGRLTGRVSQYMWDTGRQLENLLTSVQGAQNDVHSILSGISADINSEARSAIRFGVIVRTENLSVNW
ncbi:MAG: hypothetical protein FWE03_03570 [Firmicutes bacterium]|nr:hypothetical protein [Bacillota bacterium]